MSNAPPPPEDLVAYYATGVEAERLVGGVGALELARTQELILRFLGREAVVADVGGAVGHYAEWLAAGGHRVHLVEPIPSHLELARARAGEPPAFEVELGDARSLPFTDGSVDAVLLLGPLYHLGEREDRAQALREAARVCRNGGLVFAAAISRYAPLLDAIRRGLIGDRALVENVRAETRTGRRVPPERRTSPFPDAYFHLPEELEGELAGAGLEVEGVYGVEGPAGWLVDLHWDDEAVRERVLAIARDAESDPRLISVSAHLLGVGRKRPLA